MKLLKRQNDREHADEKAVSTAQRRGNAAPVVILRVIVLRAENFHRTLLHDAQADAVGSFSVFRGDNPDVKMFHAGNNARRSMAIQDDAVRGGQEENAVAGLEQRAVLFHDRPGSGNELTVFIQFARQFLSAQGEDASDGISGPQGVAAAFPGVEDQPAHGGGGAKRNAVAKKPPFLGDHFEIA